MGTGRQLGEIPHTSNWHQPFYGSGQAHAPCPSTWHQLSERPSTGPRRRKCGEELRIRTNHHHSLVLSIPAGSTPTCSGAPPLQLFVFLLCSPRAHAPPTERGGPFSALVCDGRVPKNHPRPPINHKRTSTTTTNPHTHTNTSPEPSGTLFHSTYPLHPFYIAN